MLGYLDLDSDGSWDDLLLQKRYGRTRHSMAPRNFLKTTVASLCVEGPFSSGDEKRP